MKISFNKQSGKESLGISFFWKMSIDAQGNNGIKDNFIPELFYDYFFIEEGEVQCAGVEGTNPIKLPRQTLKTLHSHPLTFRFSNRLILYGVRLTLKFAELFWDEMKANVFIDQIWMDGNANSLDNFTDQITAYVQKKQSKKVPYPMLLNNMDESSWLIHYSARHKRRLYSEVFGLSRKELHNIRNVQSFLEQTCDYGSSNPRIIQHVDPHVFYDQPHLNHSFKKITGFSPLEYFEASSFLQDNLMSVSYNVNQAP